MRPGLYHNLLINIRDILVLEILGEIFEIYKSPAWTTFEPATFRPIDESVTNVSPRPTNSRFFIHEFHSVRCCVVVGRIPTSNQAVQVRFPEGSGILLFILVLGVCPLSMFCSVLPLPMALTFF